MYRIRVVPTKSKSHAVQVVQSGGHEIVVLKHIGSAQSEHDIQRLKKLAQNWIDHHSPQLPLFTTPSLVFSLDSIELLATIPRLIHRLFLHSFSLFGFDDLLDQVVIDMVFMRLVEPASKLASLQLLASDFDIHHSRASFNRKFTSLAKQKSLIERKAALYAKKYLAFDFRIVFYDVSTLYYESFKADEQGKGVRIPGFSKDNKHQQPQIVLGLVVTKEGFPIEFRTFAGNKFEGHTLIPTLEQLKRHHHIETLTVVADAAMISDKNVKTLKEKKIGYVVGARLGNLSKQTIDLLAKKLKQEDQATIRIASKSKGLLVCQFSKKRYNKDKHETRKQVEKAKEGLKNPGKAIKRLKFISSEKSGNKKEEKNTLQFNQELLEKTKKLWGIKGYYTDQERLSNQEIIDHYHNLWQVEKAFRISKSDLQMRPIFHRKTENIIGHLLICFMALCIAKHWERETDQSVKKVVHILRNIQEADFKDLVTGETYTLQRKLTNHEKTIVEKLQVLQTN